MQNPSRRLYKTVQPLVLASESPRRAALLRSIGISFLVRPSRVREVACPGDLPAILVKRHAQEKGRAILGLHPRHWVLAADTVVAVGETSLGKPLNQGDAAAMLKRLAGRVHSVFTGVCLMRAEPFWERVESFETQVTFRALSEPEIWAYVRSGEPLDKAGAYGIQGMGAALVESVCGSYTNVVGLPLSEVVEWLMECGVVEAVGSGE